MTGYEIPIASKPDCSAWSFSVTKVYSAAVRAGTVLYKSGTDMASTVESIASTLSSFSYGLYSEWSVFGHIQILQMMMERPLASSTSWLGAYSLLQKDKWDYIIDGFSGCPFIEITNPHAGAYVFFKHIGANVGKEDAGAVSSFFTSVFNLYATTYYWGFRGADPSAYYGAGYGVKDFVRMQLYRDVSVYQEVNRRAIVCAGVSLPGMMTAAEWQASKSSRRQLSASPSHKEVARSLSAVAPRLTEKEASKLAQLQIDSEARDAAVEAECAPLYTTDCLSKHI